MVAMDTSSPRVALRDDPDRLLSYDDAGNLAGVPGRTVRKWVAEGSGPRVIQLGRHRRIRLSDWLTWIDTRYVDAA